MFNAENSNGALIVQRVQQALAEIRDAQVTAKFLHDWSSAIALTDLTDPPLSMNPDTAQALLSGIADAYGLSLLYDTGTDPRNVPAGYVYGASQKIVLGPTFK